jgi:tripartite-type tricarboxylate transporter receptor subunit TctC
LHDVTQKALRVPAVQEKLVKLGVEPKQISVEEFGQFFRDDLAAAMQLAKEANILSVD